MSDEPMTLIERLRNPCYVGLPGNAVQLHIDHTRADMSEAATEIENLRKALDLRNQEVVTSLGWLKGQEPEDWQVISRAVEAVENTFLSRGCRDIYLLRECRVAIRDALSRKPTQ